LIIGTVALLVGGAQSSFGATHNTRDDAHAYVRAADRLFSAELAQRGNADAAVANQYRACKNRYAQERPDVRQQIELQLGSLQRLREQQLTAAAYREFSRTLAARRSQDSVLRKVADSVAILAGERTKLSRARFNFCSLLSAWKRAGWNSRFVETWLEDTIYRPAGMNLISVRRANTQIVRSQARLRDLGLSLSAAAGFAATAAMLDIAGVNPP
jgi:hypothetical protein